MTEEQPEVHDTLAELRAIERAHGEALRNQAARQQEAEQRAALEAERAELARREREQAEALARLREERARQQQLVALGERRVEAAERLAREEAELRLVAHGRTVHAEALKAQRASRWQWLLAAILLVVALTSTALGYALYRSKGELARAEATRERQQQLFRALGAELEEAQARAKVAARRAQEELASYSARIGQAKTEAQRNLLLEHQRTTLEAARAAERRAARARAASLRAARRLTAIRCDPDDPICLN